MKYQRKNKADRNRKKRDKENFILFDDDSLLEAQKRMNRRFRKLAKLNRTNKADRNRQKRYEDSLIVFGQSEFSKMMRKRFVEARIKQILS